MRMLIRKVGCSSRLWIFRGVCSCRLKRWDLKSVPIGIRGQYGDKRLAMGLALRHVTFHKNITAFGENLGWKEAVRQFDLSLDPPVQAVLVWFGWDDTGAAAQPSPSCCMAASHLQTDPASHALPEGYLTYARVYPSVKG